MATADRGGSVEEFFQQAAGAFVTTESQAEPTSGLRFGLAQLFALITLFAMVLALCQWLSMGQGLYFTAAVATLVVAGSRWTWLARYSILGTYACAGILPAAMWTTAAWMLDQVSRAPGLDDLWIDIPTALAIGTCLGLILGTSFELMLAIWGAADAPFANGSVESRSLPEHRWLRFSIVAGLLLSLTSLGAWLTLHRGLPAVHDWAYRRALGPNGVTPLQEFTAHQFGLSGPFAMELGSCDLLIATGVYEHVAFEFERISPYTPEANELWNAVTNGEFGDRPATYSVPYQLGRQVLTIEICDTPERVEKWRLFFEPRGGRMTNPPPR